MRKCSVAEIKCWPSAHSTHMYIVQLPYPTAHTRAHTLRSACRSPSGWQTGRQAGSTLCRLCQGPQRCERIEPRFLSSLSKYGKCRWPGKVAHMHCAALPLVFGLTHMSTVKQLQTPIRSPLCKLLKRRLISLFFFFKSYFIRPTLLILDIYIFRFFFSSCGPNKVACERIQSEMIGCDRWLFESMLASEFIV